MRIHLWLEDNINLLAKAQVFMEHGSKLFEYAQVFAAYDDMAYTDPRDMLPREALHSTAAGENVSGRG